MAIPRSSPGVRRTVILPLLAATILAAGCDLGGLDRPSAASPGSVPVGSPGAPGSGAVGTADPAAGPAQPDGPTVEAHVIRVVDGDTIIVERLGRRQRLRYIGIDTPESVRPDTPVEPMALEASAANAALVEGKTVLLETDVSETDRFGRLLRDVWVERDGRLVLVNLELVRLGVATVTTFPPDVKYADLLLAAQDEARRQGIGLWGLEFGG